MKVCYNNTYLHHFFYVLFYILRYEINIFCFNFYLYKSNFLFE